MKYKTRLADQDVVDPDQDPTLKRKLIRKIRSGSDSQYEPDSNQTLEKTPESGSDLI